ARAAIPPLRDPPLLTMADMGMGGMAGMAGMGGGSESMPGNSSGQGAARPGMRDTSRVPADVEVGPGLA
ncbi:MAG TPA: copper resistance system multicopper oxidase, partial [Hyphomonas sp.]|nr:copper resistance system multicopper oxidase [Hyphomonas sp.]